MFSRILHGLPSQWLPRGPQDSLERAWRRRVRLLFGSESFDSNRLNHIVDVVEKQLQVTFNALLCNHGFHIHEQKNSFTGKILPEERHVLLTERRNLTISRWICTNEKGIWSFFGKFGDTVRDWNIAVRASDYLLKTGLVWWRWTSWIQRLIRRWLPSRICWKRSSRICWSLGTKVKRLERHCQPISGFTRRC